MYIAKVGEKNISFSNKIDMLSISKKINIIKDKENESCKYLTNMFNTYKEISKENIKETEVEDLLDETNIIYDKANILTNILNKDDNITIVCFDNSDINQIENYYNDKLDKFKNLRVTVIRNNIETISGKYGDRFEIVNMSKNKIRKLLSIQKHNKILISINIDTIDIATDWEYLLIHNFKEALKKFDEYDKESIKRDYAEIATKSILYNKPKKNIFKNLNRISAEHLIRMISFIRNICNKNGIVFGTIIKDKLIVTMFTNIVNMDYMEKIKIKELITAIQTTLIDDKNKKIDYIYDNLCERINNDLTLYKYCNFSDNKCIAQRDKENKSNYPINEYNGCCYDIDKKIECSKLNDTECTIKCISCRLFICRYLKDRGISYDVRDNLQVRTFLNVMQRPHLVWNFFKSKEEITNKLKK